MQGSRGGFPAGRARGAKRVTSRRGRVPSGCPCSRCQSRRCDETRRKRLLRQGGHAAFARGGQRRAPGHPGCLGRVDPVRRPPLQFRVHARPGLGVDIGPGLARGAARGRHRGGRPAVDRFRKSRQRDAGRLAGRPGRRVVRRRRRDRAAVGNRVRRRSRRRHRTQAGRARGVLFLGPGRADHLRGRDRSGPHRGAAGARRRTPRTGAVGAGRRTVVPVGVGGAGVRRADSAAGGAIRAFGRRAEAGVAPPGRGGGVAGRRVSAVATPPG